MCTEIYKSPGVGGLSFPHVHNWVWPSCRHVEGVVSKKERELELSDYFDGVDWEATHTGKKFVFFQVTMQCGWEGDDW